MSFTTCSSTFNPRSYKRSDHNIIDYVVWVHSFNPRSYKRSDFLLLHALFYLPLFQSTLLQEERHGRIMEKRSIRQLSIHAPTRGATSSLSVISIFSSLSIHAPTRGATCSVMRKCSAPCSFNPRSYKRSDRAVF